MKNYKPNPLAAGLSSALLRGIAIVSLGIFGNFGSQYEYFVNMIGHFYLGYSIGVVGIIIGFLRALLDAFCTSFVLIRLYNITYKIVRR